MELFKICIPSQTTDVRDLYLRVRSGTANLQDGVCVLSPDSEISMDTYFNVFSSSKYAEYTRAEEITISTSVSGNLLVELRSFSDAGEKIIEARNINSENPEEVKFSFKINALKDEKTTLHYLVYLSHEKSTVHSFGSYVSDLNPDMIDLGIVICTFKREDRVIRTLSRINQMMFNDQYGLENKITVYVVDNGRTLDEESINYDHVKLIPNENSGGAGGFTRGIIESRKNHKTHTLLMDDDIELDPNVIFKTFNLISILNDKHKDAFILGGMLLPETPSVQYEAGAEYLRQFKRGKHMLNFSSVDALLQNDDWEPADYGGWWYICMPENKTEELPLPLFIKLDDVEFGLRQMRDHIVMNGIGIWHDSFESKTNPVTDYYFLRRNSLILYSLYGKKNGVYIGIEHLRRMLHCVKRGKNNEYRYTRRAVTDFLKGPEFIEVSDQAEIFKMFDDSDKMVSPVGKKKGAREIFKNVSPAELLSLFSESAKLVVEWNSLAKKYRKSVEFLSSIEYWNKDD